MKTKIEWTNHTWNVLRGCSRVSEGCRNCYAEGIAKRFSGPGLPYEGLIARGDQWNGQIKLIEEKLSEPLRWKNPRRIFVNSMSDTFHENVPDEWIDRIFAVMAACPQHTFQILSKRPDRMLRYFTQKIPMKGWPSGVVRDMPRHWFVGSNIKGYTLQQIAAAANKSVSWLNEAARMGANMQDGDGWPLHNVWLGVSAENQETANERIPLLLETPAAVRWISAEPLLGPVDLTDINAGADSSIPRAYWTDVDDGDSPPAITLNALTGEKLQLWGDWAERGPGIDWVVAGGESGRCARPSHPDWFRSLRDQCVTAGVPYFFKQWGQWIPTSSADWCRSPTDECNAGFRAKYGRGGFEFPGCEGRAILRDGRVCLTDPPRAIWHGHASQVVDQTALDTYLAYARGDNNTDPGYQWMYAVGKKRAGRTLDGRTWDQYPEVQNV